MVNSTKPIICALNGSAVGVGMTMACCADIRIVPKDAKVGFPFVRRGLAAETLSSFMLPKLVSLSVAQELVLTGRVFRAHESPAGLFNYILPSVDDVLVKATELAHEIRDNCSPLSLALSRAMLLRNYTSPEDAHLIESKAIYTCITNKDNAEGITSFMQKRAPKFVTNGWSSLPDFWPWWNPVDTKAKL